MNLKRYWNYLLLLIVIYTGPASLTAQETQAIFPQPSAIFVVSDIEGELDQFQTLLKGNHIINQQNQWNFGMGHLVICGDLVDRGEQVFELLDYLQQLEQQATAAGGFVHTILGNHDIMNLNGDLRYLAPKYKAMPDYRQRIDANSKTGKWLRSKNIIEKIGDRIYLHAGVSPAVNAAGLSITDINTRAREFYDNARSAPQNLQCFFNADAPFWYRGYFMGNRATAATIDSTLQLFRCKQIIVGHTIMSDHPAAWYRGKVIGIDVDMHEGIKKALILKDNHWQQTDAAGNQQPIPYQLDSSNAKWIASPQTDSSGGATSYFTKSFTLNKPVHSARLTITAHGLYEAAINGQRVSDAYLTPGWTSYDKRLQYQEYDITDKLTRNNNSIQIIINDGWYCGTFGGDMQRNRYGNKHTTLAILQVEYEDGESATISTDSSWQWQEGPIKYSNLYHGETQNFTQPNQTPQHATEIPYTSESFIPTITPPVSKQEQFKPINITNTPNGQLIDFGQNIAGWVELIVRGKRNDTITIRYAELLDQTGKPFFANLREAKATDQYILGDNNKIILAPHFTYHGFRYALITGTIITKANCKAIALHNQLEQTGTFECSNPLINRLQSNINWSLNSNFVDVPTDCPQRSERFGWTGDVQIFARTAAFNRNIKSFLNKWYEDLMANQGNNGGIPNIIPDLYRFCDTLKGGTAGWGDAATIVPWALFEIYNDTALLRHQYPTMKAWINYIERNSTNYLWTAPGYGDWYAQGDSTSIPMIDQCFFAYSTSLVIKAATALNQKADSIQYSNLLQHIKQAFSETYGQFNTKATSTQTACLLALQFDLLPESERPRIAALLAQRIKENNNRLATGFLGTPYLLPVITRFGYNDLAYTLLLQQQCPSWLYPLTKDATTIWERWDAIRPDNSIQQTSFNHYAYGAVGQWLYETIGSITPTSPGYQTFSINPQPGGNITWAKTSYYTEQGWIKCHWKIKKGSINIALTVPSGTKARCNGKTYVAGTWRIKLKKAL